MNDVNIELYFKGTKYQPSRNEQHINRHGTRFHSTRNTKSVSLHRHAQTHAHTNVHQKRYRQTDRRRHKRTHTRTHKDVSTRHKGNTRAIDSETQ